jgi:DNA-binding transcriptional LysR family regulator
MNTNLLPKALELTIQQIHIFCEVCDRGSYAAAARHLGMTPPSLWSQVQLLERRYGVSLFRKEGRRIESTTHAKRLRELYRPLLTGLESTFQVVSPIEDHPQVITLVTGMRMALEELPVAIAAFRKKHPEVSLRWKHADNVVAQEMVEQGNADLAVMLEPAPEHRNPRLEFRQAYRIEYLAVFPKNHPLAKKKALRLNELISEPWVVGHPDTFVRRALDIAIHQHHPQRPIKIALETDNSAITIGCVKEGMGVGIIAGKPDGNLLTGLRSKSLRNILGDARIIVAWKRGLNLSQPMSDLMATICRS